MLFLYLFGIYYLYEYHWHCSRPEMDDPYIYYSSNLIISCLKNSQQILNLTTYKFKQATILEESNVSIISGKTDSSFNITIESNASLYLDQKCNISVFKIYGNPLISGKPIGIDLLYLYNSNINFNAKTTIKFNKTNGMNIPQRASYYCPEYFNFKLNNNTINIECMKEQYNDLIIYYEFEIPYDIIQDYQFSVGGNMYFYNISSNISSLNQNFKNIRKSIRKNQISELTFIDFSNPDDILGLHSYLNESPNTTYFMGWSSFDSCNHFIINRGYNEYLNYIDGIIKNTIWRKVCINDIPYLFMHENRKPNIVYISTAALLSIIIVAFIIIVAMIISFCFIARCNYNKQKNKIYHNE